MASITIYPSVRYRLQSLAIGMLALLVSAMFAAKAVQLRDNARSLRTIATALAAVAMAVAIYQILSALLRRITVTASNMTYTRSLALLSATVPRQTWSNVVVARHDTFDKGGGVQVTLNLLDGKGATIVSVDITPFTTSDIEQLRSALQAG